MHLKRTILAALIVAGFSSTCIAEGLPFSQDQYEESAKKIATIDSVLKHCSDGLTLNGVEFVQLQTVWRVMLLSGSYELSRYYFLQLEESEALFGSLEKQYGERAPAIYCAAMDIWSESNFPNGNPFKDFE